MMTIKAREKIKLKEKKAQLHISFSMIFSIILIIAFIFVAFYAIKYFLNLKCQTTVGLFKNDLQEKIDEVWNSQKAEGIEFSSSLPLGIRYVCFADTSKEASGDNEDKFQEIKRYRKNLVFYPTGKACKMPAFEISHIDIKNITESENPYCIENKNGKTIMILDKGFYDALVKIRAS